MTVRVPQPHICRVWPEFPENEPQLWTEFVWIVGAFGLSPAEEKKKCLLWAGQNKHKVCSGQNISYFVKSLWSSLFVRTCNRCCPLCTVLGLPHSANYQPFACLYVPLKTGCRVVQPQTKQALPTFTHWPRPLHLSHQSDNASQRPDKKNKFPCFCGVFQIAAHRDLHIKCDFRTNANTEDKTSAGCPGVYGVPSGQLKGSHRPFTFAVSQLLQKIKHCNWVSSVFIDLNLALLNPSLFLLSLYET